MSSGMEGADIIEPWLFATLTADQQLMANTEGVHGALTPDDPGWRYVSIAQISNRDVRGVSRSRFAVDTIYLVKAVGETTTQDDLLPAARRISALLEGRDVDVPGGHLTCTRELTVSYAEVSPEGRGFLHLGAQFRIRAHSTT